MNELFKRDGSHNEIFDTSVVKYTINIPIKVYARITNICKEKHIHRSVWFRDAVNMAFNRAYTTQALIEHEQTRPGGRSKTSTTDHPMHQHPGFISRLMGNSFLYNKYRREKDETEKYK